MPAGLGPNGERSAGAASGMRIKAASAAAAEKHRSFKHEQEIPGIDQAVAIGAGGGISAAGLTGRELTDCGFGAEPCDRLGKDCGGQKGVGLCCGRSFRCGEIEQLADALHGIVCEIESSVVAASSEQGREHGLGVFL